VYYSPLNDVFVTITFRFTDNLATIYSEKEQPRRNRTKPR